jgi:hypothetical protein
MSFATFNSLEKLNTQFLGVGNMAVCIQFIKECS